MRILKLILLFLLSSSFAFADTFKLDPNHTFVTFHISHFGFSSPSGKWSAKGTLILDKEHPDKSSVEATINVGKVITGIDELDDHLRQKAFFDVSKYPIARFVSNKVDVTGDDTAKVQGLLTIRGISKPVTLDVKINKIGKSMVTEKMTVGVTATTMVKRSEFGMTTFLPGLGDDVKIDIEAEANKD